MRTIENSWLIGVIIRLLNSRKFWLAFIVAITAGYLYVQGTISAEHLVNALVVLGSVLALAIAGEDISANLAKPKDE